MLAQEGAESVQEADEVLWATGVGWIEGGAEDCWDDQAVDGVRW